MLTAQTKEWLLVLLCLPGRTSQPVGILLLDAISDELAIKLKPTINVEEKVVSEVWAELADDLRQRAREMGGARVISWLEGTASHTIQISSRNAVVEGQTLEDLYSEHVDGNDVKQISRGTGA
jgi:hypothetical protein